MIEQEKTDLHKQWTLALFIIGLKFAMLTEARIAFFKKMQNKKRFSAYLRWRRAKRRRRLLEEARIAEEIEAAQNRVSQLPSRVPSHWTPLYTTIDAVIPVDRSVAAEVAKARMFAHNALGTLFDQHKSSREQRMPSDDRSHSRPPYFQNTFRE